MVLVLTAFYTRGDKEMEGNADQTRVARIKDFCRMDLARIAQLTAEKRTRELVDLIYAKILKEKLIRRMVRVKLAPTIPNQLQAVLARGSIVFAGPIGAPQTRSCLKMELAKTAQLGKL